MASAKPRRVYQRVGLPNAGQAANELKVDQILKTMLKPSTIIRNFRLAFPWLPAENIYAQGFRSIFALMPSQNLPLNSLQHVVGSIGSVPQNSWVFVKVSAQAPGSEWKLFLKLKHREAKMHQQLVIDMYSHGSRCYPILNFYCAGVDPNTGMFYHVMEAPPTNARPLKWYIEHDKLSASLYSRLELAYRNAWLYQVHFTDCSYANVLDDGRQAYIIDFDGAVRVKKQLTERFRRDVASLMRGGLNECMMLPVSKDEVPYVLTFWEQLGRKEIASLVRGTFNHHQNKWYPDTSLLRKVWSQVKANTGGQRRFLVAKRGVPLVRSSAVGKNSLLSGLSRKRLRNNNNNGRNAPPAKLRKVEFLPEELKNVWKPRQHGESWAHEPKPKQIVISTPRLANPFAGRRGIRRLNLSGSIGTVGRNNKNIDEENENNNNNNENGAGGYGSNHQEPEEGTALAQQLGSKVEAGRVFGTPGQSQGTTKNKNENNKRNKNNFNAAADRMSNTLAELKTKHKFFETFLKNVPGVMKGIRAILPPKYMAAINGVVEDPAFEMKSVEYNANGKKISLPKQKRREIIERALIYNWLLHYTQKYYANTWKLFSLRNGMALDFGNKMEKVLAEIKKHVANNPKSQIALQKEFKELVTSYDQTGKLKVLVNNDTFVKALKQHYNKLEPLM